MRKIKLTEEERELITSNTQDQNMAHEIGAYEYLDSIHMVPRFGAIASYINALELKSVLDVGCGTGELRHHLPEKLRYVGLDISEAAVKKAEKKLSKYAGTKFINADFVKWDSNSETFDCVIWAGIGIGFANALNITAVDLESWAMVIRKCFNMSNRSTVILECIKDYEPHIRWLTTGFNILSDCQIDCNFSNTHPGRYVCVIQTK